jgi:hypothetical protein
MTLLIFARAAISLSSLHPDAMYVPFEKLSMGRQPSSRLTVSIIFSGSYFR